MTSVVHSHITHDACNCPLQPINSIEKIRKTLVSKMRGCLMQKYVADMTIYIQPTVQVYLPKTIWQRESNDLSRWDRSQQPHSNN